jgi:hypothetical protein
MSDKAPPSQAGMKLKPERARAGNSNVVEAAVLEAKRTARAAALRRSRGAEGSILEGIEEVSSG